MSVAQPESNGLVHEALFYHDEQDYARCIARFLREGFELAEPALVAVPGSRVDVLRSAMGPDAEWVRFVDMAQAGRNPGRIIPTVLYAFAREHQTGRVRIVGEPIWPGRSAAEYRAGLQHEALINIALADEQATILCPYDLQGLDAVALADARKTHPVLIEGDLREVSPDYGDPGAVADASLRSLPDIPELWGDMRIFSCADDLRSIRQFVEELALKAGLRPARVSDLCMAVNEVATNTLVHTGRGGVLSLWQDPATHSLICEITDSGQLRDRLVGRIPPAPEDLHGRGLILVNLLCDLVEMPTGQIGTGTTVRLHMALRAP
jgi:anti-sigma regulatory factor (Ser/Thr protein kinase)